MKDFFNPVYFGSIIILAKWQFLYICRPFVLSAISLFGQTSFGSMSILSFVFQSYVLSAKSILARCPFGHVSFGHMSVRPFVFRPSVLPPHTLGHGTLIPAWPKYVAVRRVLRVDASTILPSFFSMFSSYLLQCRPWVTSCWVFISRV